MHVSSPNATVVMGCELSISLTAIQLNECLGKLRHAHPLIHKIVTINEQDEVILTNVETSNFSIVEYEDQLYQTIAEKHLKNEWKLGKPMIKFIVNLLEDGCQVIVSCNHAICDGLSLVYLLEDIASYFKMVLFQKREHRCSFIPITCKRSMLRGLINFLLLS